MLSLPSLEGKKILVTGGSGLFGHHLVSLALSTGAQVVSIDRDPSPMPPHPLLETRKVDLLGTTDLGELIPEGCDAVIHLAARSNPASCRDFGPAFDTNVGMTARILEAVRLKGSQCKVLFASTALLYDAPEKKLATEGCVLKPNHNNYVFTKYLSEMLVREYSSIYGMNSTMFRLANIYGPHPHLANFTTFIPEIVTSALQKGRIEVRNPSIVRDWLYVSDAAEAFLQAVSKSTPRTLNISTGVGTSTGEVAGYVGELTGAEMRFLNEPSHSPGWVVCDSTLAQESLGWKPSVGVKDGLRLTLDAMKKIGGK